MPASYSEPYPLILAAMMIAFLSPMIKSLTLTDLSTIMFSKNLSIAIPFFNRATDVRMSSSLAVMCRISTVLTS